MKRKLYGVSGEVIRPGARQTLHGLLRDTLKMSIYKEHCEWVHPLFEAHVRPTLVTFYNSTKASLERADRCDTGVSQQWAYHSDDHPSNCVMLCSWGLQAILPSWQDSCMDDAQHVCLQESSGKDS